MKKIALVLAMVCVTLWGGLASAGDGVEVAAGVKMWYNEWTSDDPADVKTELDASLLVGPAVEVKFPNHIFIEASYLLSVTDYEGDYYIHKVTAERKDLDLTVGYDFIPQFGAFVGYKSVTMDWDMDLGGGSGSDDLTGPMIGVRGNVPLNDMVSIYGSAAYLFSEIESSDSFGTSKKEDAPGMIMELGAKAAFTKELSGTLGYKYEATEEDESKIKDTFAGFTFGVMYTF